MVAVYSGSLALLNAAISISSLATAIYLVTKYHKSNMDI